MKYNRNIHYLLIVNLVIFSLTFILVEGAFRLKGIPYSRHAYTPNENSFARFDHELGWSYLPNKSAINESWGGAVKKPVHFDENGFRRPDAGFQLSYNEPSVIFIGGSFTMGHGLSYEESFVGTFDNFEGMPFQVVNMGVQGYGSDQALLILKKNLHKFNAKVVVYTFIEDHIRRNGIYDRRMLIPTAKFLGTKPQLALNRSNELYVKHSPLLYKDYTHSYLIDFFKIRVGTLIGSFPYFPEDLTKQIILEMKKYSNEHGAHFLVLNWRWSQDDYDKLFQELDIDIIDTLDEAPSGWEDMVLFKGVHPNAEASAHVAELLLRHFKENRLFVIN